jgi:hypothetical protein
MVPEVGIYRDVPNQEYQAWDAASASRLNKLARSAAHLRYAIDHPEQTDAQAFGEMLHTCVLQPELFQGRYVVAPKCDRRTKAGKTEWGVFEALNADRQIVEPDPWRRCENMAHAVRTHPAARALLDARMDTEVSAVWKCRRTGVLCKLRADALADLGGIPVVIDLKTTEDASRRAFERSIWTFGYHRQAAMYLDGLAAHGRVCESFCFIAVEKSPPHAVAVYRITDEVVAMGGEEVARLLATYGECVRTGRWCGYGEQVVDIGLPAWTMRQIEDAA